MQHDVVVYVGDTGSRCDVDSSTGKSYVYSANWTKLYESDQIRTRTNPLHAMSEGRVNFPPTYHRNDDHIPGWLDRVLFDGDVVCREYLSILGSEKRDPVRAMLDFGVDVMGKQEVVVMDAALSMLADDVELSSRIENDGETTAEARVNDDYVVVVHSDITKVPVDEASAVITK